MLLRDMANYESNLDLCFSALGDPTRRMILQRLAQGEASVSELAKPHDMALPSFMEHLRKLEARTHQDMRIVPDRFYTSKKLVERAKRCMGSAS